ncbi:Rieske 2Fe-2S domain-containing protein [Myxococcaceae bacterium JPH2]|nr:Rieske 2Fe-2S domain-containing protein [Myxococcaceae bacterium JPH2]
MDRRAALGSLWRGTCALAVLGAGCGREWRDAAVLEVPEGACGASTEPGTPEDGWVEVPLADHPALREPGGQAVVHLPQALLDVVVVRTPPECVSAVWRTCTHGACLVAWDAEAAVLECPCHGSRFGLDGHVLRGPATRPLATFRAVLRGESLFIFRPR